MSENIFKVLKGKILKKYGWVLPLVQSNINDQFKIGLSV